MYIKKSLHLFILILIFSFSPLPLVEGCPDGLRQRGGVDVIKKLADNRQNDYPLEASVVFSSSIPLVRGGSDIIGDGVLSSSSLPSPLIQNLSSSKYFDTTLRTINSAKSSIYLTMYFIALSNTEGDSKVLQLVNALIEAKKRGVKVKVILDRTYSFTDSNTKGDARNYDTRNQTAYNYLKENGIEVYYDGLKDYTHTKCLVVDEEIVIAGSTNWTTSALTRNNEVNVLIDSKELAEQLIDEFFKIELDLSVETEQKEVPSVEFSVNIMPTFKKFIERRDDNLLRMYFYLIQRFNFEFGVEKELDFAELREMFLQGSKAKESKQNYYIRRYLKRLQDEYKLIQYLNAEGLQTNIRVILNSPLEGWTPKVDGVLSSSSIPLVEGCPDGLRQRGGVDVLPSSSSSLSSSFQIPQTFWQYGWYTRLDTMAIYCYLVNIIESGGVYKTWSKSIEDIHKQYGIRTNTISQAMDELRYWNLIQITYSQLKNNDYSTLTPNTYRLMPVYSLEDFEKAVKDLEVKYTPEQVDRARKYAGEVYCEHDIYEIENIIQLELDHGEESVKRVFDIVGSYKSKANSKKSMRYVVGVLNNEED